MLPLSATLLLASLATPTPVDAPTLTIAYGQETYYPGQEAQLFINGPVGLFTIVFFDPDPGPTDVPGLGLVDLGLSAQLTTIVLGPLPEGGMALLDRSYQCGNPIVGTPMYTQAVGLDLATLELCLSNPDVLNIVDTCEGCTPGYWKNHLEDWAAAGFAPEQDFDTVFGVDAFDPDLTLVQAVNLGGGGVEALARHAVAALLSAGSPDVSYGLTVDEVIGQVQSALADGGDVEGTKDFLAMLNEEGCPL